jgi:uncharacterized damage-inducible protein DinB
MAESKQEAWLRGPIDGVPPMLQGIALGLTHSAEEVHDAIEKLTPGQLTARPSNVASIAFHVRHIIGALDRLFTYGRGEMLSTVQRSSLKAETGADDPSVTAESLRRDLDAAVTRAIAELRGIDEASLASPRFVGRAQLPSTVIGLLSHAAEHTARHTGQIVTTSKIVRG